MKFLLILVTSCSLAVLGDAEARCERWAAAMSSYESRCHLTNRTVIDCSNLIAMELDIDGCEAALASAPCQRGYLPDVCAANVTHSPF